jgi:hypothetical protein
MIFGAIALPITVLIGMKGPEYLLTGVESGVVVGGVVAGIWYFATSKGILIGTLEDVGDIFKEAVCAIL